MVAASDIFLYTSRRGQPIPDDVLASIGTHKFYREDQARDEAGRWTDEGGGGVSITGENVEQHRGDVKSHELAKHKDKIESVFNMTPEARIVPTHSLISTKNELLDPKFVRGEKADPRQTATDRMVANITESGAGRAPLDVRDNKDGTFTIIDGNATAQAAMLAGWTKLPVHVVEKAPTPPMTDIDRTVIDHEQLEDSLTDPAKTKPITDVLHRARYVPYAKTKFFTDLGKIHGIDDVSKSTHDEYKQSRKDFFNALPIVKVPLDQVVVTQENVNKDKLGRLLSGPPEALASPIKAVRYKGETYIIDGHHRAVANALRGEKETKARLLDIGDTDLTPEEIDVYRTAGKQKPQLDKIINEVATQQHATGLSAPLKALDGRGGARDKVKADYKGDWSQIKDVVRGRILPEDEEGVKSTVAALRERLGIEPKITINRADGFSDYKFNPVIEGRKTEIGVMTRRAAKITEETHPLYKQAQFIQRNAMNENRNLTPDELEQISALNKQMKYVAMKALSGG